MTVEHLYHRRGRQVQLMVDADYVGQAGLFLGRGHPNATSGIQDEACRWQLKDLL